MIKKILDQLLSEESDGIPTSTFSSYRKWCDANSLRMDDKASVTKFTSEITAYLSDNINFRDF
jgi:hypothetical protein